MGVYIYSFFLLFYEENVLRIILENFENLNIYCQHNAMVLYIYTSIFICKILDFFQ